jgi:hemerythrin-like metal-binding protein
VNLNTGVEDFDTGYQALVNLLNQLGKAVRRGAGTVRSAWFDKLAPSTEEHFRRNEEIIARESYPEAEHRQGLQEALTEEMREFREAFEGRGEIGSEATEFIRSCLIRHVRESDKQLGGHFWAKTYD